MNDLIITIALCLIILGVFKLSLWLFKKGEKKRKIESKLAKQRFEVIRPNETMIIHNQKKMEEGIIIYWDKRNLLSTPFRLTTLKKEQKLKEVKND